MAEKSQANYANMTTVLISVISNGQNFLDAAERVLIYAPETSQEFLSGHKPSLTLKVVEALKTSHSQWNLSCGLLYILEEHQIEVDENRLWICDVMNIEYIMDSDQTFKDNLYALMEDLHTNVVS